MKLRHAPLPSRCCATLPEACRNGHNDCIRRFLRRQHGPTLSMDDAEPPLVIAAGAGDILALAMLLEMGHSVYACGRFELSAFEHAARNAHESCLEVLLNHIRGVERDSAISTMLASALLSAADAHSPPCVRLLLDANVAPDAIGEASMPALCRSALCGHVLVVQELLRAGADVNWQSRAGHTALELVCIHHHQPASLRPEHESHVETALVLASYGARRRTAKGESVRDMAMCSGNVELADWLARTDEWSTPLHYVGLFPSRTAPSPERTLALLREGADICAARRPGAPSPLSLAKARQARFHSSGLQGTCVELVLLAARPWSRRTHHLFPRPARLLAGALLAIGRELAARGGPGGGFGPLLDIWEQFVIPMTVSREYAPPSTPPVLPSSPPAPVAARDRVRAKPEGALPSTLQWMLASSPSRMDVDASAGLCALPSYLALLSGRLHGEPSRGGGEPVGRGSHRSGMLPEFTFRPPQPEVLPRERLLAAVSSY